MKRITTTVRLAAVLTTGLVVAVGCSSSGSKSSTGGSSSSGSATTAAPTFDNSWALNYTGGKAGKADPSLTPITVGYVNQEGGTPAFPEATQGIDATAQYINTELGGVQGHPIALEKCLVQTEEDGQKCGTQLANDSKVSFVITGALANGNQSLYNVLTGKKPVLIGNPLTTPDFTSTDGYAYTPGAPGVVEGMAVFIAKNLTGVKKVAAVYNSNPSGTIAFTALFKPPLAKLGITDVVGVPVADTATATDVTSALQAAGADKADVVAPLTTVQSCIATYDALQSLGLKPTVVTTGLCFGTPMTKHLSDLGSKDTVPNGWYFGGYGYSYFLPEQDPGMNTYVNHVVKTYGPKDMEYTGFAGPMFGNLMTATQLMNKIGPTNVTPDSMRTAIKAFTGPQALVVGPMACGSNTVFKTLCGEEMNVQQYKDGKWTIVAPEINPKTSLGS